MIPDKEGYFGGGLRLKRRAPKQYPKDINEKQQRRAHKGTKKEPIKLTKATNRPLFPNKYPG
jgi:hypothetical protein